MIHSGVVASLMLDLQLDLGLNLKEQKGAREGNGNEGNFYQSFLEAGIHSTFADDSGLLEDQRNHHGQNHDKCKA